MIMGDILRYVLAAVVSTVFCVWVGWNLPTGMGGGVHVRGASEAPVYVHPGAMIAEAARRFGGGDASLQSGAGSSVTDTSVDVTADSAPLSPVSIDIAEWLRRDLAAVISEDGVHTALILDAGGHVRSMGEGSPYRHGWRIKAISTEAIVLTKGRDQRRIPVMGGGRPALAQRAALGIENQDVPRPRLVLTRQDARARRP